MAQYSICHWGTITEQLSRPILILLRESVVSVPLLADTCPLLCLSYMVVFNSRGELYHKISCSESLLYSTPINNMHDVCNGCLINMYHCAPLSFMSRNEEGLSHLNVQGWEFEGVCEHLDFCSLERKVQLRVV